MFYLRFSGFPWLDQAAQVTNKIIKFMNQADADAARVIQIQSGLAAAALGASAGATAGGAAGAAASAAAGAQAAAANRMLSPFSARVRQIANQSPTLRGQLATLERQGWTIQLGPRGGGSYADSTNKRIVIDRGDSVNGQVAGLAHEAGHATSGQVPYHAPTRNMTRQQYIDLNVQEQLRNEGIAQLNAATARDEIQRAGGPNVGIPGSQTAAYQQVYGDLQAGRITRAQAIDRMTNLMGNETTSTTNQNYRQYYGQTYRNHWDTNVAPGRRNR